MLIIINKKSTHKPSGLHYQSLLQFLCHEATRSTVHVPTVDGGYPLGSISSGFPDSSPVPIYTPGWGEALSAQEHRSPLSCPGPEPGPYEIESNVGHHVSTDHNQ